MAFTEDLDPYFVDFGVDVTLSGSTFKGLHDKQHIALLAAEIGATGPAVLCKASDVGTPAQDTAITVNGTSYKVRDVKPDGTGLTLIELENA